MTTIYDGDPILWWHGQRLVCPQCGRIEELEDGDENLSSVGSITAKTFEAYCRRCQNKIELCRPITYAKII